MYTLVGRSTFLGYCAYAAVAVAFGMFLIRHVWLGALPATPGQWASSLVSLAGTGAAAVAAVVAIGEGPMFPWLCERMPLGKVFPCIEGDWDGVLNSNFAAIRERDPSLQHVDPAVASRVEAKVRIKARLLTVSMNLKSRSLNSSGPYQDSETIVVEASRVGTDRYLRLTYVFEAAVPQRLSTDASGFLGAARLNMEEKDGRQVLTGHYWTNRNWEKAQNTAGTARFERVQPASAQAAGLTGTSSHVLGGF